MSPASTCIIGPHDRVSIWADIFCEGSGMHRRVFAGSLCMILSLARWVSDGSLVGYFRSGFPQPNVWAVWPGSISADQPGSSYSCQATELFESVWLGWNIDCSRQAHTCNIRQACLAVIQDITSPRIQHWVAMDDQPTAGQYLG